MGDRETPRMRKYGERKTTRIMMATVPHVTSGSGLRKFQADGFLFDRVYNPEHCRSSNGSDCFSALPILRSNSQVSQALEHERN